MFKISYTSLKASS